MNTAANDGGLAFPGKRLEPSPLDSQQTVKWTYPGMTMRDYFAAKAMPEAIRHHLDVRAAQISPGVFDWDLVAVTAYKMADAMLKERSKL